MEKKKNKIESLCDAVLRRVEKEGAFMFIPAASRALLNDKINARQKSLARYQRFLAQHGEGMSEALVYEKKGCDWRLKEVEAEAQKYLKNVPSFMHQSILEQARAAVDTDFIKELQEVRSGCVAMKDVEVDKNGTWVLSKRVVEQMTAEHTFTLTDEQIRAIRIFKEMANLADRLHEINFFLDDINPYRVDYFTEVAKAEFRTEEDFAEYITSLERMTEAEIAQHKAVGYR